MKPFKAAGMVAERWQEAQGSRIMCPEEIAFELGYLSADDVLSRARRLGDNDYSAYLRRRIEERVYE